MRNIILVLAIFAKLTLAGYGDAVNGQPSPQEREVHLLTNMVRVAPIDFRDQYIQDTMILKPANYPAVDPLYWNAELGKVALAHSTDMATNNCFQHESCNGTTMSTRVAAVYKLSPIRGENIAAGTSTALAAMQLWIRDPTSIPGPNAADKSSGDGHRRNIMDTRFKAIGIGYAPSSTAKYKHYWTQDFGGVTSVEYPIASGGHVAPNKDSISFVATYKDASPATNANVILNGKSYSLTLASGTNTRGNFILTIPKPAQGCYTYYFSISNHRYPETQSLSTDPGKDCSATTSAVQNPSAKMSATQLHSEMFRNWDLLGRKKL